MNMMIRKLGEIRSNQAGLDGCLHVVDFTVVPPFLKINMICIIFRKE